MLYDEINEREQKFHKTLIDSYRKKFTSFVNNDLQTIIELKHPNDNWYYKQIIPKKKIVIHSTAGILHADIGELTRQKVSTAYVIARDGTTYNLFDPKYWSYHLGPGAVGGNKAESSSSIAIELCNVGPLTLSGSKKVLSTWAGTAYCGLEHTEAFTRLASPWRGYEYFASYTEEQYRALDTLLTNLCRTFGILRKLPSSNDVGRLFEERVPEGIWGHDNFRKDKTDPGPAFDWSRISGR